MTAQKMPISIIGLALVVGLVVCFSSCASPTTPDSMTFQSTTVNSHSHTLTLSRSEIQELDYIDKTTAMASGHVHRMVIVELERLAIKNGQAQNLDTKPAPDGHIHFFNINKWW